MRKVILVVAWMVVAGSAFAAPAPDSKRLALAKDYIAEEQWRRAIAELEIVVDDAKDANRDEALFWLAHSRYQVGEYAEALQTVSRLERLFVKSRWVRPAHSLRVEIAQRLGRDDLLWRWAVPPPPPPAPRAATPPAHPGPIARMPSPPVMAAPPATPPPTPSRNAPPPPLPAPPATTPAVPAPAATPPPSRPGVLLLPPTPAVAPAPTPMPTPFEGLLPAAPFVVDSEMQMQALVSLLDTHSDRVIPLLREMALDPKNPSQARRAVFALAQSPRPEARHSVVEAARRGPGVVRIAAIREMGRVSEPVFTTALIGIARSESDPAVRDTAIVTLGRSGARVPLRTLYSQLAPGSRFVVLTGLFNAKDDDELIRIATHERDPRLRTRAREHLRLLATPKALKYLADNP
jgi:hypothetical protein